MSDTPRISRGIRQDMCIACGACICACPVGNLRPAYSKVRGAHEVEIIDPGKCAGCQAPCDSVCPSVEVDFARLGRRSGRMGPVEAIYLGYAPKYRFNGVSSSGGVIRACVADALEAGRPVICLAKSECGYEPAILRGLEELDNVPGSIYHGVSFVKCIELLRSLETGCALVCTPCQLRGIRRFIEQVEPELQGKIALVVGLICGWMYSDHAIKAFAAFKGIREPIIDARYRGEDKVGLLKLTTKSSQYSFDRRKFASFRERIDYAASFSSNMNRLRCRLCQDHVNVLADIAVGDAWLERKGSEKLSVVIARTPKGLEAISRLREKGDLVTEESGEADIIESQSAELVYGTTARKLAVFLAGRGVGAPEFTFAEDMAPMEPGRKERLRFAYEMICRYFIRGGHYSAYRALYVLRYAVMNAPAAIKRLVGRRR